MRALKNTDNNLNVIAPSENRSAIGHSITIMQPLVVDEVKFDGAFIAHQTDGTPSDCVRLAVLGIIKEKPDLVVSGINMGENLGDDITYSGTVSAALEAVINGIPSIAVSLVARSDFDFETAAEFTAYLINFIKNKRIDPHTFLNVNVPNIKSSKIKGVEITHLGRRIYRERLVAERNSEGKTHYVVEGDAPSYHFEEGTDFSAIRRDKISITPLHIDMTNYKILEEMRRWEFNFRNEI